MLWGECISGALLWTELGELCEDYGLSEPLLVESSPIEIKPELLGLLGTCKFVSATYRIFKPPTKPTGQKHKITYLGTIDEHPDQFILSAEYIFKTGVAVGVPVASVSKNMDTRDTQKSAYHEYAHRIPGLQKQS